jgi:hypothetical protein
MQEILPADFRENCDKQKINIPYEQNFLIATHNI